MKGNGNTPLKKTGRPLSFDRDAALQKAMLLFWRHGYEGTSLSDLRSAMGVTSPSIYAAYGDKKRLFLAAVQKYLSGPVTSEAIIRDAATASAAAEGLLRAAAIGYTGAETPAGCLLATSAISGSGNSADVQAELASMRRAIEQCLRARIEAASATGELPVDMDAAGLAGFLMTIIQGMSTMARDGASREKLLSIAGIAMRAWPDAG
jgi:AcrR family transcriptional regulator